LRKQSDLSNGQSDAVSTDIMTLYKMVNSQPKGGFRLNHDGPHYGYFGGRYVKLQDVSGGGGAAFGAGIVEM
jgi:hypothetical protein